MMFFSSCEIHKPGICWWGREKDDQKDPVTKRLRRRIHETRKKAWRQGMCMFIRNINLGTGDSDLVSLLLFSRWTVLNRLRTLDDQSHVREKKKGSKRGILFKPNCNKWRSEGKNEFDRVTASEISALLRHARHSEGPKRGRQWADIGQDTLQWELGMVENTHTVCIGWLPSVSHVRYSIPLLICVGQESTSLRSIVKISISE